MIACASSLKTERTLPKLGTKCERCGKDWTPTQSPSCAKLDWQRSKSGSGLPLLAARVGTDEDKYPIVTGLSLGKASLTEMESDLAAVEGLRSSVLVKLQELSIGSETKAPVRRVRVSEFFNRPIQTQAELDKALDLIRDSLQKYIDEGAVI